MIRESLADSNQIQWQVLAKSLQLQLTDSRLWQVLYIYSISSLLIKAKYFLFVFLMRSRLFSWLKIRGSLHLLGFLWNRKTKHKPWKSWFCEAMTADTLLLFEHAAGNQSWNSEWLSSSCFMNYSDRSGREWLQALFPRADSSPLEWRCSMYSYSWRRNITEPSMNRT